MVNFRNYIRFIAIAIVALPLFVGCKQNEEPIAQKEMVPVRLYTIIELGGFDTASTRAVSGKWDEKTGTYVEGNEKGSDEENAVGTIRVLAFEKSTGNAVANILYRRPDDAISGGEKKFAFSDGTGRKIYMDLRLYAANYEFVMIANESPAWDLQSITTKADLTSLSSLRGVTNGVIAPGDLTSSVNGGSGIPMVGSGDILVTIFPGATVDNPQIIGPAIQLKRTLAKVEVNLTNKDADNGNVIFETANVYQIKEVTVRNANQVYNVLEGDNTPVTEVSNPLTQPVKHNVGEPFDGNVFSAYMAERKDVKVESNAVIADVTVIKSGEEITYSIPIYQSPDAKDYSIYRNTIYRLNCILQGNALTIKLVVLPWELVQTQKEYISEAQMDYNPSWNPKLPTLKIPYSDAAGAVYDVATFTFKLIHPVGGVWRATLTNGLEFAFKPGTPTTGVAGTEYAIEVVALKPATAIRTTEFYLTVDGVEIDPDSYILDGQLVQGPITTGLGNRYVIKQVM